MLVETVPHGTERDIEEFRGFGLVPPRLFEGLEEHRLLQPVHFGVERRPLLQDLRGERKSYTIASDHFRHIRGERGHRDDIFCLYDHRTLEDVVELADVPGIDETFSDPPLLPAVPGDRLSQ